MMGLVVGVAAGIAAGLLIAPMRGTEMRASLRSRADEALGRGMSLFGEGRAAFNRNGRSNGSGLSAPLDAAPPALTATLGEFAEMHGNDAPFEAQS